MDEECHEMIVGDPSRFALESEITYAYERPSQRALGFFAIHIGGRCYGIRNWDATMLATVFDGVSRRVAMRGRHSAPNVCTTNSEVLATAFSRATYVDHEPEELFLGMRDTVFLSMINSAKLEWTGDGDEGFDDGSCVLQFDVEAEVRLIAFSRATNPIFDPETLRDVCIPADDFYAILQNWHDRFLAEWESLPKDSTPYLH
jgi:hypothetical protein